MLRNTFPQTNSTSTKSSKFPFPQGFAHSNLCFNCWNELWWQRIHTCLLYNCHILFKVFRIRMEWSRKIKDRFNKIRLGHTTISQNFDIGYQVIFNIMKYNKWKEFNRRMVFTFMSFVDKLVDELINDKHLIYALMHTLMLLGYI